MTATRIDLPRFTIITGLSGAGRSEAAKNLEDLGYFVIDNLPPALIERMASLVSGPGIKVKDVALVVDVRGGEFFPELEKALTELRERGIPYRILFLEASDQTIVRRFEATRRRHPLAVSERVIDGIHEERTLMAGLLADKGLRRAVADDPALAKGVNVVAGFVVLDEVADAHGLPHTALDEALAGRGSGR